MSFFNNNRVAVKVINLDFLQDAESKKIIEEVKKEAGFMSMLDHPNILKFKECFQKYKCFCIVSEYCEVLKCFYKMVKQLKLTIYIYVF